MIEQIKLIINIFNVSITNFLYKKRHIIYAFNFKILFLRLYYANF